MENTGRLLFPPKGYSNSDSVQLVAGSSIPRGHLFGPVPEMTFSTIRDSETTVTGRLIKVFVLSFLFRFVICTNLIILKFDNLTFIYICIYLLL